MTAGVALDWPTLLLLVLFENLCSTRLQVHQKVEEYDIRASGFHHNPFCQIFLVVGGRTR